VIIPSKVSNSCSEKCYSFKFALSCIENVNPLLLSLLENTIYDLTRNLF
jgi:hypothetical protein